MFFNFVQQKMLWLIIASLFFCKPLIVHSTNTEKCDHMKLELVQVLFRHGARTPMNGELTICNCVDASLYEPWGYGELCNKGKQQEYQFGNFLRERYADYLSDHYKPEDLYAYVSDLSRTKMSMELVLAGLYHSDDCTQWNGGLKWRPIPYISIPSQLDILLRAYEKPKYLAMFKEVTDSDEFKNKIAKYSNFYEFLADKTKYNGNMSIAHVLEINDVLVSTDYMNITAPDWYTPEVEQIINEIQVNVVYDTFAATMEMRKMMSGPLIKTFIENMNLNKMVYNPRKIYLYGGHDANVAVFTRSHGISEFRNAVFGSAVIVEKLRDCHDQVYVRLFAWDGLGKLTSLKIPDCEEYCHIDDYLKIVEPVIPSEMEIDEIIGYLNASEVQNLYYNINSEQAPQVSFATFFDQ